MAAELVFAPEVARDVADAYGWYERQREGLGEELLSAVDACLCAIVRNPDAHRMVRDGYRRALLRRFPYAVFYEHAQGRVTVYGVFHTSRNPAKWRRRLP